MKEITIIILLVTMLCMTFCNLMSAFFLQQKFQSHLKTKYESNTWYYLTNVQFVIYQILIINHYFKYYNFLFVKE